MPIARIISQISNQYTLETEQGERLLALPRGRLHLSAPPLVGDLVTYGLCGGQAVIEGICPRRSQLERPAVANVDQALIVMSLHEPDFSYQLVDRLIFLAAYQRIEPVIVLTKLDLEADQDAISRIGNEYQNAGYRIYRSGRLGLNEAGGLFAGKITVLTGQSGVGKSSLLNQLDPRLALSTQPISKALGRGKHTTRHTSLYPYGGGWIADTPGFSSLDFSAIDSRRLKDAIPDFRKAGPCRFEDCRHLREPGCAVKEAVAAGRISPIRYADYVAAVKLCDKKKEWEK